ncbi:unnamed protein product [Larinioides sclopetarius]|uniref:PiggyBac transposable element-derived protein domain-containing protein n=1 Tax=Larinioides sclopetarius TaxID=280406 RepID=A0AAV2BWD2_9ARAC
MSRLLGDLTKHDGETFYCYSCLRRFSNEILLKDHPVPYVIYADFEALIQSIQGDITKTASHIPCEYAYLIIGANGLPLKPITIYRGADAVDHFLNPLLRKRTVLAAKLHTINPMHMTTRDLENSKRNSLQLVQEMVGKRSWAMSQPLPVGDFEWVSPDEIPQQQILQHSDDATTGYILEVDLEYPPELHDLHNSYPLAPERINITPDNLSPTALEILSEMNMRPATKSENDKARLLFTDTDSLCYELITDDLNRDFEEMKQYFDFLDYPHDHPLYSVENKKKIGFFKDELNGQHCFEFVGLRSKMNSILSGKGEKQTAKGIVKKPDIELYWSRRHSTSTPFFSKIMSYRRFHLIHRYLHFSDDAKFDAKTHECPKLQKLWPVIKHLNARYQEIMTPERDVTIDESLMLFKGRLHWKQYIPLKRSRFGIKSFMLCESKSGYVYQFIIYTGKDTLFDNNYQYLCKSSQVVMTLMQPLLNKGYCLTTDNYYTSPELADILLSKRTDMYGTLKLNRKDVPKELQ